MTLFPYRRLPILSDFIKISENDNYETYIDKCLYNQFHDYDSINTIKKRLTIDFFTIKDVLSIINYNKNIINVSVKPIENTNIQTPS
jgi:hypothetical protein